MLGKATLSTIFYFLMSMDANVFGLNMMARPIFMCPVIGLIYGDLEAGVKIGASLELMFMGIIDIGAATPPDMKSGAVLGTALAIMTNKGAEVALMLAIPLSLIIQSYNVLMNSGQSYMIKKGDEAAREGDTKKLGRWHIFGPMIFWIIPCALVFVSLYLGVDALNSLVGIIPKFVTNSLEIACGLLPAIGFAMLIDMMWTKKLAPFFFVGFVLATYFGLDEIAVVVIAVLIVLIMINLKKDDEVDFDKEVF